MSQVQQLNSAIAGLNRELVLKYNICRRYPRSIELGLDNSGILDDACIIFAIRLALYLAFRVLACCNNFLEFFAIVVDKIRCRSM